MNVEYNITTISSNTSIQNNKNEEFKYEGFKKLHVFHSIFDYNSNILLYWHKHKGKSQKGYVNMSRKQFLYLPNHYKCVHIFVSS